MYYTIKDNIETQIVVKKSKFIANIGYVTSKEEAEDFINKIKKKYHDARHNCYAYIVNEEVILERFSDDGEPSGTAGAPMLNIIKQKQLCNVIVVVTRYFGGILLGTGGLVRAYSDATIKAIDNSEIALETIGEEIEVIVKYNTLENFKYYCQTNEIEITNLEYDENVKIILELEEEKLKKLIEKNENTKDYLINIKILGKKRIRKKKIK